MEKTLLAPCGIDCAKCEAREATLSLDEKKKEAVAKRWSELNHVEITPAMIACLGCLQEGAKTPYVEHYCPIRPCALKKGIATCRQCPQKKECPFPKPTL